ncbi:MAG: transglycosylase domain-containing protein [Oscillospiraceae bacterium]|nr:transglycosylase domain-containing protein [Oscillospiraceae bacterium]
MGNARKNTPQDKKSIAGQNAGSPKSMGMILKELGSVFFRTLATMFFVMVITGCIVACVMTVYIVGFLDDESGVDLNSLEMNYTSILYVEDKSTGEYVELNRLHGEENRIWVDYENIPESLVNAAIAGEDKRFKEHQGVDWTRTLYATVTHFLKGGTQGGSTITQQLIKNATGEKDFSVERKIKEIFRALSLEKSNSKEQIMESYLNSIHLGWNTDGVQAAANLYFGKDVSQLSIAESAALIAITQNPSKRELFNHEENNRERREWILGQMLEQGYITQAEYTTAMAEKIQVVTYDNSTDTTQSATLSYFEDYVLEEVIQDLMDKYGYTYETAEDKVLKGGYRIYTTMDKSIQDYLDVAFADQDAENSIFPTVRGYNLKTFSYVEEQPDASMIIMEPNGKLVGIAGGRGQKEGDRILNLATSGVRQPGSAIKPLSVYGPAMDFDMIYWSKIFDDNPVEKAGENPQFTSDWPINHYGSYMGNVTVDYAVRRSTNTVAVRVLELLTPQVSYDFMVNQLHFTTLVGSGTNNDVDRAPLGLGALTNGVTVMEMTAAYQIFDNGGLYYEPYSYSVVYDSEGNVVLEQNPTPQRVISEDTAEVVNKLLQRVVNGEQGTGGTAKFGSMPVAGKTGTTSNDVDQWFMGMTPYYVGGVWFGYSDDSNIQIRYSSYPPPIIWRRVMAQIHEGLEVKQFPTSGKVVEMTYCTDSGEIATSACPNTATGWYKESNIPGTCVQHLGSVESEEGEVGGSRGSHGLEDEE